LDGGERQEPERRATTDDAIRVAAKVAIDAGDFARAQQLLEILGAERLSEKPANPSGNPSPKAIGKASSDVAPASEVDVAAAAPTAANVIELGARCRGGKR
jgi:hypothetical protein